MKNLIIYIIILAFPVALYSEWQQINTGIADDFYSIVVKDNYGLIIGKRGLYYNKTGPKIPGSWKEYKSSGSSKEDEIFNRSKFNDCTIDSTGSEHKFYVCGQDQEEKKAVIFQIDFDKEEIKLLYSGSKNSELNKIAYNYNYNNVNNRFYCAVGNNSLIIKYDKNGIKQFIIKDTVDLIYLDMKDDRLLTGSKDFLFNGSAGYYYSYSRYNVSFKDAILTYQSNCAGISTNYYTYKNLTLDSTFVFDYGPLNPTAICHYGPDYFVGTDHGVFLMDERALLKVESSNDHIVNAFHYSGKTKEFYFTSNNGILFFSNETQYKTFPYASLDHLKSACLQNSTLSYYLGYLGGFSRNVKWFINDSLVSTERSFYYHFTKTGVYNIKFEILNDYGYSYTTSKEIRITTRPSKDIIAEIPDNIVCRNGTVKINILNSEKDVRYVLLKHGGYGNVYFGFSPTGNGGNISFYSDEIDSTTSYYLKAENIYSECSEYLKDDTLKIIVEETEARAKANLLNADIDEFIDFYQTSIDADNFEWTFSSGAIPSKSSSSRPYVKFQSTGPTHAKMVCWSDNGCYDSIEISGPRIIQEPQIDDSCWTIVDYDHGENDHSTMSSRKLIKVDDGFISIADFYKNADVASRFGDSIKFPDNVSGTYLCKFNFKGTIKWYVSSPGFVKDCSIDKEGNIYIPTGGYLVDVTGKKIKIERPYSIVVLDPGGKFKSLIPGNYESYDKIRFDNKNNLVFIGQSGDYVYLTKIDNEGKLIWKKRIFLGYSYSGIANMELDKDDNIYLLGTYNGKLEIENEKISYYTGSKYNLFLAKFNNNGEMQWLAKSFSNISYDGVRAANMLVDEEGNCYVTGDNRYKLSVGSEDYVQTIEDADSTIYRNYSGSYFLIKFNNSGKCLWINSAGYSGAFWGAHFDLLDNELSVVGQVQNNLKDSAKVVFSGTDNKEVEALFYASDLFIAYYSTDGKLKRIVTNGINPNSLVNEYGVTGYFRMPNGVFYLSRNMWFFSGIHNYDFFGTNIKDIAGIDGIIAKISEECGITYYPEKTSTQRKSEIIFNDNILYNNYYKTIELKNLCNTSNSVFYVSDILGNILLTKNGKELTDLIDVSNLKKGFYIAAFFRDDILISYKKIIIN